MRGVETDLPSAVVAFENLGVQGNVADQLVGAIPKDKLESILARHLN